MNALSRAAALAERTADAYSFDRYGESAWRGLCAALFRAGYSTREVEAIVRSKWARWAADTVRNNHGWRYGHGSGRRAADYITSTMRRYPNEVAELVRGTFND